MHSLLWRTNRYGVHPDHQPHLYFIWLWSVQLCQWPIHVPHRLHLSLQGFRGKSICSQGYVRKRYFRLGLSCRYHTFCLNGDDNSFQWSCMYVQIFSLEYSDGVGSPIELVLQTFLRFTSLALLPNLVCSTAIYLLVGPHFTCTHDTFTHLCTLYIFK